MNPRHIAMGVGLLGAAALLIFGDTSPGSGVAEAVERRPAKTADAAATSVAAPVRAVTGGEPRILALVPREALIGADAMDGRLDVFGLHDWTPPPPPPPKRTGVEPPPPPPMAPPLPFTVLGKAVADGSWEVYLARGDKTFIVRDKTVIEGTYRVDAITPPNLTLTYLPLNQVQQLNIGVLD